MGGVKICFVLLIKLLRRWVNMCIVIERFVSGFFVGCGLCVLMWLCVNMV